MASNISYGPLLTSSVYIHNNSFANCTPQAIQVSGQYPITWTTGGNWVSGGAYIPPHYRKQLLTYFHEMRELDPKMQEMIDKLNSPIPDDEYKFHKEGDDERLLDEIILQAARLIKQKALW